MSLRSITKLSKSNENDKYKEKNITLKLNNNVNEKVNSRIITRFIINKKTDLQS